MRKNVILRELLALNAKTPAKSRRCRDEVIYKCMIVRILSRVNRFRRIGGFVGGCVGGDVACVYIGGVGAGLGARRVVVGGA